MWRARMLSVVVVLGMTVAAVAQQIEPVQPGRWHGPWWSDGYGWSFWWMCPVMMLLMAAMVFMMFGRRHHGGAPPDAALQVLNERFARGEIGRSEYEERKSAILARH